MLIYGYFLFANQLVAQLLIFPVGRLWARTLPNVSVFGVQINPGPFTVKEHVRTAPPPCRRSRSSY